MVNTEQTTKAIPKYFIYDKSNTFCLAVDLKEDMLFAATGDRAVYSTFGCPSVISDFFEGAFSESMFTWDSNYEPELFEVGLEQRLKECLPVYEFKDGELVNISKEVEEYIIKLYEGQ